jgi:UDP-2,3-diacylglucosamine pyrophosphatase LpxH
MNMSASTKRKVDLVVISDVHLGTYGCHAEELLQYLKSIDPGELILNGDIVDIWQFSKRYWPTSHMEVVEYLLHLVSTGTPVHYLTGNHDEMLRRFAGFKMGTFHLANKLVKTLPDGKRAWFFHGDVFDVTMQNSRWLAKLGGWGYDALIVLNRGVNNLLKAIGREPYSLSKKIKNSVKSAVNFISDFEAIAAEMAVFHGYDFVVCGHIHQPEMRVIKSPKGDVTYLNSGDWIENLTALEYHAGSWELYHFDPTQFDQAITAPVANEASLSSKLIFERMRQEFELPLPALN